MRRCILKCKRLSVKVALLSLLAVVMVIVAPAGSARPSVKFVPFKGSFTFSATIAADSSPCPFVRILVNGGGHATHLGRFSTSQYHCLDPADPLAFTEGVFTFTAANGDTVFGTYAGRFIPTTVEGVSTVDGTFTFTGGTGRFAGASGGGLATGSGTATGGTVFLNGSLGKPRKSDVLTDG